ncbi:DJ-1/PfpI family protein [Paucibacter sp. M5-1]|uniref:DJ-1/PfpI family protein n=1 Tax=Paucibacter sp. M5-1 TaxID=3015998 RepID=UPI0022B93674|nr:DJ-1/PfpI family protein [Paucibacter sp. M5-1]MCZ7882400.1 DJ-1/PfpI family protein [Paucibacter sp. M5-1]
MLLYPGCIFFEIALAAELLASLGSVLRYYTPDGKPHLASMGACILPQGSYADLARDTGGLAAVLVPGGDPGSIIPQRLATPCLRSAAERGVLLAGICAGNLVLASAGLLRGRRGTHNYTREHASPEAVAFTAPFWEGLVFERADLVTDEGARLTTAQPWAYVSYAAAVARGLGLLNEAEAQAFRAGHQKSYADPDIDR